MNLTRQLNPLKVFPRFFIGIPTHTYCALNSKWPMRISFVDYFYVSLDANLRWASRGQYVVEKMLAYLFELENSLSTCHLNH